jgi:serine/threonine-protein kinase
MNQLDVSPIEGTEGGGGAFFSPDGQWVGFLVGDNLKKVSMMGGPAANIPVTDFSGLIEEASWGPDDTIVFSAKKSGLFRVAVAGGVPQPLTKLASDENAHKQPHILPGGEAILFVISSGSRRRQVAVHSPDTAEHSILADGVSPRYLPTGHIVFGREDSLWAVPFDLETLKTTGSPVPFSEKVRQDPGSRMEFAVADDGSLAYMPSSTQGQVTLVWVDRNGQEEATLTSGPEVYHHPRISPDGKQVAVSSGPAIGAADIWIYDVESGRRMRLTVEGTNHSFPVWTPDGKQLLFLLDSADLYSKSADGSGQVVPVVVGQGMSFPHSWTPDGRTLVFTNSGDLWLWRREKDISRITNTPFSEISPRFSPDGNWLAYSSDESGQREVYVRAYPGSGKWTISIEGGVEPVWSRDGRQLFYRSGDKMMVAPIETESGFAPGTPEMLFEKRYDLEPTAATAEYDISPDGQRFLMVKEESTAHQINIVLNWFEELKARVPVP